MHAETELEMLELETRELETRELETRELETRRSLVQLVAHPLAQEAERVLGESGYAGLRRLRCDCQDGVISIRGKLASFFLKQMAQTLVSQLPGVRRVSNQINVT